MKFVALLRGVNVGGRVIKMAEVKACFEAAGFEDVTTVLQSGNVIFSSDKTAGELKALIQEALTSQFNYPAKAQVIEIAKLEASIKAYPFKPEATLQDYVIFIENGLEKDLAQEAIGESERVKVGEGVVYWQVEKGQTLKTSFAQHLTKSKYRDWHTNRNLRTLQKITGLAS